jgi:hypothetical protein
MGFVKPRRNAFFMHKTFILITSLSFGLWAASGAAFAQTKTKAASSGKKGVKPAAVVKPTAKPMPLPFNVPALTPQQEKAQEEARRKREQEEAKSASEVVVSPSEGPVPMESASMYASPDPAALAPSRSIPSLIVTGSEAKDKADLQKRMDGWRLENPLYRSFKGITLREVMCIKSGNVDSLVAWRKEKKAVVHRRHTSLPDVGILKDAALDAQRFCSELELLKAEGFSFDALPDEQKGFVSESRCAELYGWQKQVQLEKEKPNNN